MIDCTKEEAIDTAGGYDGTWGALTEPPPVICPGPPPPAPSGGYPGTYDAGEEVAQR